jgi:Tfp pilus assembly protein PilE
MLLELLIVVVIIGILLAMGISYLSLKDRANRAVARANVVTAVPTVEAYYVDNQSYTGMTWAALHAINSGVSPTLELETVEAQRYCISDSSGNVTFHKEGPAGLVGEGGCP